MKQTRFSPFRLALCLTLAWALFATPASSSSGEELSFKVVVHADHPLDTIPRDVLARIFMNKMSRWDDGTSVIAVDLPIEHPARDGFSRAVLRKSTSAVNNYWQRMIFSGRGVPPAQMSERALLAYLCTQPGAIGYVDCDTPLIEGVKELKVLNEDGELLLLTDLPPRATPEEAPKRVSLSSPSSQGGAWGRIFRPESLVATV